MRNRMQVYYFAICLYTMASEKYGLLGTKIKLRTSFRMYRIRNKYRITPQPVEHLLFPEWDVGPHTSQQELTCWQMVEPFKLLYYVNVFIKTSKLKAEISHFIICESHSASRAMSFWSHVAFTWLSASFPPKIEDSLMPFASSH